jgi:hypothetical protein
MHDQSPANRLAGWPGAVPPLGRYYEAGGRRLLLHRAGSGSRRWCSWPAGAQLAWTT